MVSVFTLSEVLFRDEDRDVVFTPNLLIYVEQCWRLEKRRHMGVKVGELQSSAPRLFYLGPDFPIYFTRLCHASGQIFIRRQVTVFVGK